MFAEQVLAALADLLWVPRCAACAAPLPAAPSRREAPPLCAVCRASLVRCEPPACPRCGIPFEGPGADHLCAGCLVDPPPFTRAHAPYLYGGALAQAIAAFKYRPAPWLARPLGTALAAAADRATRATVVVPIPLHRRRLARRGFNQAALLAAPVARALGLPRETSALQRRVDTPHQAGLGRAARQRSLAGAFTVGDGRRIVGADVLLVDDVVTTTATARAATAALLAAGARSVEVLALARAAGGVVAPPRQSG